MRTFLSSPQGDILTELRHNYLAVLDEARRYS